MGEIGAYGERFGGRFHLKEAPAFVMRTLRRAELAVTEIRQDAEPEHRLNDSVPREDAFLVALQLRAYPDHEYWEDGRKAPICSLQAGDITLYDLRRDPRFLMNKPFHSVHFYLPRAALVTVAEEAGGRFAGDLDYPPGAGIRDDTLQHFAMAMRVALELPEQASQLSTDHLFMAVVAHVAQTYGRVQPSSRSRGGLAPWQERRAKEILRANLDGDVQLRDLAHECGLSPGHFSRAFRQTTGAPPHAWLMHQRVEAAKSLLRDGRMPLNQIALATGFASQSHFTRVFAGSTGTSPGAWRRLLED